MLQPNPVEESDAALARSVLYERLALAFQPPSPHRRARLASEEARGALTGAVALLDPERGALQVACERALAGPPVADGLSYDRIFGHTARGPICPLETEYGLDAPFRQPHELAHISGFYAAFGLRARQTDGERSDHISCECSFMGFLARKEALLHQPGSTYWERSARGELLATTRDAAASFFRSHLGRFGTAFATRVRRADPDGFLGRHAQILQALLQLDAARLRLPLGPATLDLRPPIEDQTPMACASCPTPGSLGLESPGGGG